MGSDNNPAAGKRTAAGAGLRGLLPSIFKGPGLVVVLVAVAVGSVAKFQPSLFFKIPEVGFIPWGMTGGAIPPYITYDVWEGKNHESWLKDNDVVISTGAKSGTTWMLYCTHQIRVKGQAGPKPLVGVMLSTPWPETLQHPCAPGGCLARRGQHARAGPKPFVDVMFSTPWPEILQHPAHTAMGQIGMMHNTTLRDGDNLSEYWNNAEYPFRIFKSHYAPRQQGKAHVKSAVLPVRERRNVKFVAMARNGLEVVRSFNQFLNMFRDEWRGTWGGFPPRASEDDITELFHQWLPAGRHGERWWEYVACWWPFRDDPNVLLLHYADMLADPRAGIRKLAAFVGVDLTPAEFEDVAEK
ncbi:P-loop containing nucleoside triphosphate hydrolase protein [Baffinella frigidus]|nr:P-loop containing nucleoside triphosphate hydrolase protein [Cryptophyta sp. CCMP2293]